MRRLWQTAYERWSPSAQRIKRYLSARGAIALACCLLAGAYAYSATRPLDDALSALRSTLLERAPSGNMVIVEIDSRSLRAAEQWPWPRERFARAIDNLQQAGADLIGFDVDFSARSSVDDDEAMRAAIESDPGRVVLPTFLQRSGEENRPLSMLSNNAVLASVNVPVDADGRVRRYNRGFTLGDRFHPSMAAVLAGAPYGDDSQFMIDFAIRHDRFDRLSFEDVLRGDFDPARVRGKTILIGATALELGDEFATPVNPTLPGVYLHALAYESLASGRALAPVRGSIVFAVALMALLLLWPRLAPLNLRDLLIRHGALLAALLLAPALLQYFAPISLDVGLILLAQIICIGMSVRRELSYRAAELDRQREAHLAFVAMHDPETNLPNRRAMLQDLSEWKQERGAYVVAAAVGIDRFSTLRGAVGYGNANRLVRSLFTRLQQADRPRAVYHISTSILGVVVGAADEAEARRLCGVDMESNPLTLLLDEQEIDVGIRIGGAYAMAGAISAETLLERASLALDLARLENRRCSIHSEADFLDPRLRLSLMSDVSRGLERGEFSLRYQAKTTIRGEATLAAEALMRWRHPTHGDIAPDHFIPVAEETGAIDSLTRWALRTAIADQACLRAEAIDATFSVNVSGRSLLDQDFCQFAIDAIVNANAKICLEITETAIIGDPKAAMASIAAFRAAGIAISIDDYGVGLSSLTYLKQIDADEIKLDKSLICDLTHLERDRLILRSTIDLAHALGMSVVAEGVEDETSLAILSTMGCDAVQGYFLARPEPLSGLRRMWQAAQRQRQKPLPALGRLRGTN